MVRPGGPGDKRKRYQCLSIWVCRFCLSCLYVVSLFPLVHHRESIMYDYVVFLFPLVHHRESIMYDYVVFLFPLVHHRESIMYVCRVPIPIGSPSGVYHVWLCCVPIPIGSPSGVYHVCTLCPYSHWFTIGSLAGDHREMLWNEALCKERIEARTFWASPPRCFRSW
jgi:hypothetical protein